MNERVVALDIGDARIGVAVSDASRLIASPVDTIYRKGWGPDVKKVVEICQRYDTTLVLSGWPLNMDGTAGFQSEKVKQFCLQLEKAGLTVFYQDERLTTVTATNALIEGGMHRADRKHNVDKVAAAVILQQWLDTQRQEAARHAEEQEENTMTEENRIIQLIDDETGEPVDFEHLRTFSHEGETYIALTEYVEEETEDEECQVYLFRIVTDEENGDTYRPIEDEALEAKLFQMLLEMMEEDEEDDE